MLRFRFILPIMLLLLALPAAGREWDEQLYRQIEQSIQTPQIEGSDYDITKFGAKPSATAARTRKPFKRLSTNVRRRVADASSFLLDRPSRLVLSS